MGQIVCCGKVRAIKVSPEKTDWKQLVGEGDGSLNLREIGSFFWGKTFGVFCIK